MQTGSYLLNLDIFTTKRTKLNKVQLHQTKFKLNLAKYRTVTP